MSTINQQLNIPEIKGGATLMQPNLYNGTIATERSRAYNYPLVVGSAYWNAGGEIKNDWDGHYSATGDYSNLYGKSRCKSACEEMFPDSSSGRSSLDLAAIRYCKQECDKCKRGSRCRKPFAPSKSAIYAAVKTDYKPDATDPTKSNEYNTCRTKCIQKFPHPETYTGQKAIDAGKCFTDCRIIEKQTQDANIAFSGGIRDPKKMALGLGVVALIGVAGFFLYKKFKK